MKIEIFHISVRYKGEVLDVDLKELFINILKLEREKRLRKTYKNYPIIMELKRELAGSKYGLSVYKYREDYKPYIEDSNGILKQIEEEVVELTNCILDYNYNLIAIQFHLEGIRAKSIETYLNSFIDNQNFKIVLEKIYKSKKLNDLITSDRILSVQPIFSVEALMDGIKENSILGSLANFIKSNEENALATEIVIKNVERNGRLSGEALKLLLNSFEDEINQNKIEDLYVLYINNDNQKMKVSIKDLREQIGFEILKREKNCSWERILDKIEEEYSKHQRIALKVVEQLNLPLALTEEEFGIKDIADEKYLIKYEK